MEELVINLHMHTTYSDGMGSHEEIAQAALKAGLDAVFVTDHNVWVDGLEGYRHDHQHRVLLLVGEEVHDRTRQPQKNHLLVLGAHREMAPFGENPQTLINQTLQVGGLAFIAHPVDPALPAFGEDDISWVDWQVSGYNGIELWNGFSELKSVVHNYLDGLYYAFNPKLIARGPHPEAIRLWDELTLSGRKIVAIGGSDAHALRKTLGPIKATLFPYEFHFRAINTHLYAPSGLSGDLSTDKRMLLQALREGHAFIGYDLLYPTRGFRFTGQGREKTAWPGDEISGRGGVTLQVSLPTPAETRLIKDGKPIQTWHDRKNCTHIAAEPGVYRAEVYREAFGKRRGWIFSNPIYIRE